MVALKHTAAIFALLSAVVAASYAEEPKARLKGLERNAEYMSLLREDAAFERSIDSLTAVMNDRREHLYDSDDDRKERTYEILNLEGEIMVLRGRRSKLAGQINLIEQEWLMANMPGDGDGSVADTQAEPIGSGRQYTDLVRNDYFARSLSRNDYAALLRAQREETAAAGLYKEFAEAHAEFMGIKARYDTAATESAADSLLLQLSDAQARCGRLSDSLASVWGYVFDNKSYIYDLLLDREEREDLLVKAERNITAARQEVESASGRYASDAVVEYCLQKPCILKYEADIASFAGLKAAEDSLARALRSVGGLKYDYGKTMVERRWFIEYQPMKFSSRYVYNANNPIPQCTVYEHGVIYRIKLGEYSSRQVPAQFRGLEPVSYIHAEDGRWRYYGGGYASVEELENHLKTVKKLGHSRADVAAWRDGVYADNRKEAEALMSQTFAVEISGAETLSPEIRGIISRTAADNAVSRTGRGTFIVGGFKSQDEAQALAASVAAADKSIRTAVVEAAENK